MKGFIFTILLCVAAFVATLNAQKSQEISHNGIIYTTQKPPLTEEDLKKNSSEIEETLELNGVVHKVFQSKPTKKYPNGRLFIIMKNVETNKYKRLYLYEK